MLIGEINRAYLSFHLVVYSGVKSCKNTSLLGKSMKLGIWVLKTKRKKSGMGPNLDHPIWRRNPRWPPFFGISIHNAQFVRLITSKSSDFLFVWSCFMINVNNNVFYHKILYQGSKSVHVYTKIQDGRHYLCKIICNA